MAEHQKALAEALKNLKGRHGSGGKKAPAEKEVIWLMEDPSPASEPRSRKCKVDDDLPVGSRDGNAGPRSAARSVGARYRGAIDRVSLPRRFADMEAEG